LTHTAGLDRKNWSEYSPTDSIPSLIQMLKGEKPSVDKGFSFINEPGKTFKYSNTGYLIAQKAIEDVTGEPFARVAEAYVFKPLHMNNSSFLSTYLFQTVTAQGNRLFFQFKTISL